MENARAYVTGALRALEQGEPVDLDALVPILYRELRALANTLLKAERPGHTLQPTALTNEAWMRLVDAERVAVRGRTHFLALAARVMRRILIEHARRRDAAKRGGGRQRVTLAEPVTPSGGREVDLLALDEALDALAAFDERKARVVELRYFTGMTVPEVAAALGVSETTAEEDWYFARAWLARRLGS
jgi:RNA polymerase sigma factor (TIGR02999 family)